jgi:hypothetical protein
MGALEELNVDRLEVVQNRLAASLIKQARELAIAAKDWVQGGWSRSSATVIDKIEYGIKLAAEKEM